MEVVNSKKNSIASISKHENLRFVTVLLQNAQSFIAVLFADKSCQLLLLITVMRWCDLISFAQFKKRERNPRRSVAFSKVPG